MESWPISTLKEAMQPDRRGAVVREVLGHYQQVSPTARQWLERTFRDHVKVRGFRDPTQAPVSTLAREVVRSSFRFQAVMRAILLVWMEIRKDLRETLSDFLDNRAVPLAEPSDLPDVVEAFQGQHTGFVEDDIVLMLHCMKAFEKPVRTTEETMRREESVTRWQQWLEELQALPSDSPEWEADNSSAFIEAVRQLSEIKLQEREAPREQLRFALAALAGQPDSVLAYFRIGDVSCWTADECEVSEAVVLENQVTELNGALARYQELDHQPAAAEVHENRRRRSELTDLEDTILRTYESLSNVFGTPPSDDPPPEPNEELWEEEAHQEETDPTDSGDSSSGTRAAETKDEDSEPDQAMQTSPLEETGETEVNIPAETVTSGGCPLSGEITVAPPEQPAVQDEAVSELPSGLCSSQEAATRLESDDRDQLWHALLWALVAEDDLPGAYWLVQSLNASGRHAPMPDYVLKAAQGARWLASGDEERLVSDLLDIAKTGQPASNDAQTMVGLAGSLRAALIAPRSGMMSWLKVPSCCPELHELVDAVKEFAELNIVLLPEALDSVAGVEQQEATMGKIVHDAQQWLREAPSQRTTLKRASKVWQHLVGPRGTLREMLLPVGEDRRSEAQTVKELLGQWEQESYISDRIHQIDRQLAGKRPRPIDGAIHKKLVRDVKDACQLARLWWEQGNRSHEIRTRGDWRSDQVHRLRDRIHKALPEAEAALGQLSQLGQSAPVAAAALCLRRAVRQIDETLNLQAVEGALDTCAWEWFASDAENLSIALSRRLLWLPELTLDDDGQPLDVIHVAPLLREACSGKRGLRLAFEGWLQRQDYRFIEILLGGMRGEDDETRVGELSSRYQEALDGSRATLGERLNRTNQEIEQAVVDGIIGEERSEYNAIVVSVGSKEVLNFPPEFESLDDVRNRLADARKERLEELRQTWRGMEKRLDESHIEPAERREFKEQVSRELDGEDTRVVEERIAQLEAVLDHGDDAEEILSQSSATTRDVLAEFNERAPRIAQWLEQAKGLQTIVRDIERGPSRPLGGISFEGVPKPRRDEAVRAIAVWRRLKQQVRKGESLEPLVALLGYLGFAGVKCRLAESGKDWLYVNASMSASEYLVKSVPQFGSQAQGHYDVICLWERPGAEVIAARLRELRLTIRNVLVVYLGRLKGTQQRDVARTCRERGLAIAILDETLLLFLAPERGARLPVFLHCALPFTALDPYSPFQAGDVPPEMFYGREQMVRELQIQTGSCLVYGGRQLGKSALLRHVERQFHRPDQGQFAWVEDMKLIFDPKAGKDSTHVWRVLREGFKRAGLLPPSVRTDNADNIARYIEDAMKQEPHRRVIVMYDEADDFLDYDASDRFRVVLKLRELMSATQRRFKVVFAGLHNVQRFQGIPNQPLAHFGAPIRVGPLEPRAAQDLVQEPLRMLGYRFADDANVLRILSYTNYHPGLIQIFCQELLRRLHRRMGRSLPPYLIEQNDVENVYRLPDVRERIRERFDWTLALDLRYQAIAWAMIFDQMEMEKSSGYASVYPPGEILELVRYCWPQGFEGMTSDQLRSLLGELCGLGVLVRNGDGHYRLRSPNLVRLMGTETDIENRLAELSDKKLPGPFDADNHHAPLDDEAREYSPLSYAQDRRLIPQHFGVGLVCASEATGLSTLPSAFGRYVSGDSAEGIYAEIPSDIMDGDSLNRWLDKHLQTHKGRERLVVCYRPPDKARDNLGSLADCALKFCRRHQSRSGERWLRILFLFDPLTTWAWLSLPEQQREKLENLTDAVARPHLWNLSGVRQRLSQHNKMDSEEVCRFVLEATGGWPLLLGELFRRCGTEDDPRPSAKAIGEEVARSDSALGRQFRASLGLDINEEVRRVWEFIRQEDQVPAEWINPDMVGGASTLKAEVCASAVEYLEWMGCLSVHRDLDSEETMVLAEPTVKRVTSSP